MTTRDLLDVKFVSRSAIGKDTWRSATPRVAAAVPMELGDPDLYLAPLKAHAAAPLAEMTRTNRSLQVCCSWISGSSTAGCSGCGKGQQLWRLATLICIYHQQQELMENPQPEENPPPDWQLCSSSPGFDREMLY